MTDRIADVMRERANSKGQLVGVFGVAKQGENEVAGADVVGKVREELVTEGVVAHVLNDTAAVRIGASAVELRGCETGIAAEQKRNDRILPGQVDELLMSEKRVGDR